MRSKIFIDGAAGTTGLEIRERLAARHDLDVVQLSDGERKDVRARKKALNDAGVVILCLPDEAAREAVALIDNPDVRVIDASTAHRVAPNWAFGFPEFSPGNYETIAAAGRVTNPGCYATGFIALVAPLIRAGLVPSGTALSVNAVSGYSGGGKAMIAEFEDKTASDYTQTVVRTYALSLAHKHVPEMTERSGLEHPPVFAPSVGRYYRGMIVEVPLHLWALPGAPSGADLRAALADTYRGRPFVDVAGEAETASLKTLDAELLKNTNRMKLYVFANEQTQQARLTAVLDNLGKGASGAAVQNLNIMLGLPRDDRAVVTAPSFETALAEFGVVDGTLRADERATLDRDGFVVLRGVFDSGLCGRLRETFERRYLPSDRWPVPRGHDTRHAMLNDEPEIQLACLKPAILAAAHHLLRRRFFLSDVQGRDPKPGGGHQRLHRDWVAPQGPAPIAIALAFLDPFGPANGATRVIAGSHVLDGGADAYSSIEDHPTQIVVEGEGGDVLMMDGYLAHGGLRNAGGAPRRNLQIEFRGHELHASYDETRDLGAAPPALRYLLGQDA